MIPLNQPMTGPVDPSGIPPPGFSGGGGRGGQALGLGGLDFQALLSQAAQGQKPPQPPPTQGAGNAGDGVPAKPAEAAAGDATAPATSRAPRSGESTRPTDGSDTGPSLDAAHPDGEEAAAVVNDGMMALLQTLEGGAAAWGAQEEVDPADGLPLLAQAALMGRGLMAGTLRGGMSPEGGGGAPQLALDEVGMVPDPGRLSQLLGGNAPNGEGAGNADFEALLAQLQGGRQGEDNPALANATPQAATDTLPMSTLSGAGGGEEGLMVGGTHGVTNGGNTTASTAGQPPPVLSMNAPGFADELAGRAGRMRIISRPGQSDQVRITLDPRDLGEIKMHLKVDEESRVHLMITAETEAAKEALNRQMSQLREALAKQNLGFGEVMVQVDSGNAGSTGEGRTGGEGGPGQAGQDGNGDPLASRPLTSSRLEQLMHAIHEGGVNIIV